MQDMEHRKRHTSLAEDPVETSELVDALRNGSPLALRAVVESHRASLLHFARQNLSGTADPEDIVQEAFLRLWAHRNELRPGGSIKALLYATVRSLSLDEYRRWKRRTRWDSGIFEYGTTHSPLDDLLGAELNRLAQDAIHKLPPRRRAIFQMVRNKGLSYREAADTLGISTQTVANSMSSALSDLRASLAPLLQETTDRPGR
jgi:RNA polymerase sigma-70 factor (ECF subfamily)